MSKRKLNSLQALRTLSFLGIFTSHSGLSHLGAWGVSIFIVLSGFLMSYNYKEKNLPLTFKERYKFSIKKIKNLYPLHIITIMCSIPFVIWAILKNSSKINIIRAIFSFILDITLLKAWIPNSNIYFSFNGVSWYLCIALIFYFSFPLINKIINLIKSKKTIFLLIILIYIVQFIFAFLSNFIIVDAFSDNFSKWFTYVFPLFRLGDFIIGCLLGALLTNYKPITNRILFTIFEVIVIVVLIFSQYASDIGFNIFGQEWFKYSIIYLPTTVLIIILFFYNYGYLTKILTNKFTIFIGNISSEAFLIHSIVINYLKQIFELFFNNQINSWLFTIIAFIATIITTIFYNKLVAFYRKKKLIK